MEPSKNGRRDDSPAAWNPVAVTSRLEKNFGRGLGNIWSERRMGAWLDCIEKDLIGRDTINNMLSWNHSGFSADASVRVETIADAVRIGRYMIRSPIVLERLNWDDERVPGTTQTLEGPFGRHSAMGCSRAHRPSHRPYPRNRTATDPKLGILFQRLTRKTPARVGPSKFL